jgi:hypothetical protein
VRVRDLHLFQQGNRLLLRLAGKVVDAGGSPPPSVCQSVASG